MAFPSTSVLDAFARADAALSSGNWATLALDGTALNIVSQQIASGSSGIRGSYWSAARFDLSAVEIFATIPVKPTSTNSVYLSIYKDGTDSTPDGYGLNVRTGDFAVERITAGAVAASVIRTTAATWSVGDQWGMSIVAGTITVYRNGVAVATATDSTHTGGCHLAVEIQSTTPRVDDFGGGTVVASGATVAHYDGSRWTDQPLHVYDGSAWRPAAGITVL